MRARAELVIKGESAVDKMIFLLSPFNATTSMTVFPAMDLRGTVFRNQA